MKNASEYRLHAEECRILANRMRGEQRDQLLDIAVTWENLAAERASLALRHPERALSGEHQEEARAATPLNKDHR